ncbi:MAG: hypothetical protein JXR23_01050 [Pontiellaceae bacterium]|nr:hypothetical protein [Pontiellaceae bacterium]
MKRPQITQIDSDSVAHKKICVHLCNLWILLALVLSGCKEESKAPPKGQLTIEYSIDRDAIQIGDPVELSVTAYYPKNGVLQLPPIGRGKEIVQLKRDSSSSPREDGLKESTTHYRITSFRLGDFPVSTNSISCAVGEQLLSVPFPEAVLHVKSALTDDASDKLEDIKSARKLPAVIPRWVWIVLGAALVAFLAGLITSWLWKNRKQRAPEAPPLPPHVIALNALEALWNKGLLEKDECNLFYTELSMILRIYLDGRFRLNAPDQTTEEIVWEMSRSVELNNAQQQILQEFMRQADKVKFAKDHPDRQTMENAFNTTKQFVDETKLTDTQSIKHEDTKATKSNEMGSASSTSCLRGEKQI